jgi:hypothetical protein
MPGAKAASPFGLIFITFHGREPGGLGHHAGMRAGEQ